MGYLKDLMVCLSLNVRVSKTSFDESKLKTVFRCLMVGGKKVASASNVIT